MSSAAQPDPSRPGNLVTRRYNASPSVEATKTENWSPVSVEKSPRSIGLSENELEARRESCKEEYDDPLVIDVGNKRNLSCGDKQQSLFLKFKTTFLNRLHSTPETTQAAPFGKHSLRKLTQRLRNGHTSSLLSEVKGSLIAADYYVRLSEQRQRVINPDSWHLQTPIVGKGEGSLRARRKKYLLSVRLDSIQFTSHPQMREEEVLVNELLESYRCYQASELRQRYESMTAELRQIELELLETRETMFAAAEQDEDATDTYQQTLKLEEQANAQVYSKRQEKEDVGLELIQTLQEIVDKYTAIANLKADRNPEFCGIKLETVPVTCKTKKNSQRKIEKRLHSVEYEKIKGLPRSPLPLHEEFTAEGSRKYRRLESTCQAHSRTRAQLLLELHSLENSTKRNRKEIQHLTTRLEELGSFPQRVALAENEKLEAKKHHRARLEEKESDEILKNDICVVCDEFNFSSLSDAQNFIVQASLQINGELLGNTQTLVLNSKYQANFHKDFKIFMYEWPKNITLRLHHQLGEELDVDIKIPLKVPQTAEPLLISNDFTANALASQTKHPNSTKETTRNLSGMVNVCIQWETAGQMSSGTVYMTKNPLAAVDVGLKDRLIPPTASHHPEPDEKKEAGCHQTDIGFRLITKSESMFEPLDWLSKKRVQLLKERWELLQLVEDGSIPEGEEEKIKPAPFADIISIEAFEKSIKPLKAFVKDDCFEASCHDNLWNERKEWITKFIRGSVMLQAVENREKKLKQLSLMIHKALHFNEVKKRRKKRKEDVVRESMTVGLNLTSTFIKNILSPPRKLRPKPKQVRVIRSFPTSCKVILGIRSVTNLPVRATECMRKNGGSQGFSSEDSSLNNTAELSPFVEVTLNDESRRTSCGSGPCPLINSRVKLPFIPKSGNLTPSEMLNCRDLLQIRVFDELGTIYSRPERECKYLGQLEISLATIYHLGCLDGNFRLTVPVIVLNYRQSKKPAFISLSIRFDPPLPKPPSNVVHPAARRRSIWQSRPFVSMEESSQVLSTSGEEVAKSHFISKTPLPPDLRWLQRESSTDEIIAACAEFVRSVPSLAGVMSMLHNEGVWQTSAEVLNNAAARGVEKANLLAGLCLELGIEASVVLGTSISSTNAAFVLTRRQENYLLWNPLTAAFFTTKDISTELREATFVYNDKGVWRNVQNHSEPWSISWEINNSRHWALSFCSGDAYNASTDKRISYEDLEVTFYEELENRTEEIARIVLCDLRRVQVTPPHRHGKRVLKRLLRELPTDLKSVKDPHSIGEETLYMSQEQILEIENKHRAVLAKELGKDTFIDALVFSLRYSDRLDKDIEDLISGTKLHETSHSEARFAIGVWVEPMGSAFLCQIWLYIAVVYNSRHIL